ncbi:zinc ribbon domain-containing protein, partial [bacterium D16-54]
ERPIRQKVRIEKDIQTLPETKQVWYCLNCGYENRDGVTACGFCDRARSTEETKFIDYAHDTYAAVHSDNISAERDGGWYETAKDWLGSLLKGNSPEEEPESIGNFRFKAYLKSNLERLYRDEDGHIVWMDRNGNTMKPQYEDTNGDSNYDTFTWKYDTAYGGRTVDFPEKDKVSEDGVLSSSNVQKIYTDVMHRTGSMTTSARANNLWDTYADPQGGA